MMPRRARRTDGGDQDVADDPAVAPMSVAPPTPTDEVVRLPGRTQSRSVMNATTPLPADALNLDRVSKTFGAIEAVKSVSLDVASGMILSLLGPSGCGKTTILRMIAGFLRPTAGAVRIHGEDVTDVPTHRRKLGMVFQNYSLFPHMTVAENVAFGLKMQGVAQGAARAAVDQALAMVRMAGMQQRYPAELSGGQQQRVALARAVATRPRLLLLDEPFGALDRKLREEMQIEVKHLQRGLGITFVFVTHDQEEALTLSDRLAVMQDGEIRQAGTPTEIFETPDSLFVAEFFGALNKLPVQILGRDGANVLVSWRGRQFAVAARAPMQASAGSEALFAARASDVRLSKTPPGRAGAALDGVLEETIYRGTSVLCRVRLQDGTLFTVIAERGALAALEGATVFLSWPDEKGMLFPRPGKD
jgi:spermidine/putrescine ABC transporter ATP-binding subunit